jgi:D-alanine-D-alanine ligase
VTRPLVLLVGGRSTEHDASLAGYRALLHALDDDDSADQVEAVVYVPRRGGFRLAARAPWPVSEPELGAADAVSFDEVLRVIRAPGRFTFSLLHGNEGEDGAWQGLAEVLDVPGNFGPVLTSALGMNKRYQAMVAKGLVGELCLPDTWMLRPTLNQTPRIVAELAGRPAVVKPNRMGASLFATRIADADPHALWQAATAIFPYDEEVLVQQYIDGRELTCGVIREAGATIALPVVEAVTQNRFLGHREKHGDGLVEVVVDPPGGDALLTHVANVSRRLFDELGCLGFARFDFLVQHDRLYFLEVNTLPGIMAGSAFPRMLQASGRGIAGLIELCAADADSRRARQAYLPYTIAH